MVPGSPCCTKEIKNQNTGAYIYTNGRFTKAYPVKWWNTNFAAHIMDELCADVGITVRLKSDLDPNLLGDTMNSTT